MVTFAPKRILVAGDYMIDRYTIGKARRISPEAPVPVLWVEREEERAGGAGNVVLNVASLGMVPVPFGVFGKGSHLPTLLNEEGIATQGLLSDPSYQTPTKVRVIAHNQQVVRIDYEQRLTLSPAVEEAALKAIPALIEECDLVAISDYAKGFLTDRILRALIDAARARHRPLICDPKGIDMAKYAGVTLLKPNLSEAQAVANLSRGTLHDIARAVLSKVAVDVLMITKSEEGISLFYPDGRHEEHPVAPQEVRDVTGAGDTVLAMLCAALANGMSLSEATRLANAAAAIAIRHIGCARVTLAEVLAVSS